MGFILTTIVGTYINDRFQKSTWEREKRFEILSRRLDEGTKFIDELSDLMNRRFFGLQRLLWVAKLKEKSKVTLIWDEYYLSVIEWNHKLNANHSRVKRFANNYLANEFLNFADDDYSKDPSSIHGRFKLAHECALKVRECAINNCKDLETKIENAQSVLTFLDIQIDNFILQLTQVFQQQAQHMENL